MSPTGYNGVRYLTNEYQYILLFIMLDFAQQGTGRKGGRSHKALSFESLSLSKNARYRVLGSLQPLRDSFLKQAIALTGSPKREQIDLLRNEHLATHRDERLMAQLRWVRNHYLHRSARLVTEHKMGMAGRPNQQRLIIDDNKPVEKFHKHPIDNSKRVLGEVLDDKMKKAGELYDDFKKHLP